MRALGFSGLAAALALLPAAAPVAADSGVAAGGAGSSMTTGVAPRGAGGWGSVPNAPLHPPAGGWGPGGWQGTPGALPPGGPVTPGAPPPPVGPGGSGGPSLPPPGHPGGPPPSMHGGGPRGGHWAGHYPRVGRGHVLPRRWLTPNLYVHDWWSYGLGRPGYGQNWLRYYDDALLVDDYGRVLDYRYDMDWDRGGPPPGDEGYERGNYDHGWGPDGPIVVPPPRPGMPPPPVIIHHGGRWGGGETTVVVVQGAPTVTTTTTTTYEDVIVRRGGRTWQHRRWHPKPHCRCK